MNLTKNLDRGLSESLQGVETANSVAHGINITYWNDNNAVCFMDNDIEYGEYTWTARQVQLCS